MNRFVKRAALFAAVACVAGVANAQTSPSTSRNDGPLGDPMRLGQPQAPTQPAAPGGPGGGDDQVSSPYWNGGGNNQQQSDLPAADIRAVPGARAAAVEAKMNYWRAERERDFMLRDMNREFERSADYRDALTEEAAAWKAYQAARESALQALMNDPVYQANESLRADLTEQIKDLHDATEPAWEQVVAMASLKADYASPNRKLESAALDRDDNVKSARDRLIAAGARARDLRAQHDDRVYANGDWRQMRRTLDELRVAKVVTDSYLDSVIRARNIALNYAYDYRGIDRYRSTYAPYYGYGYGGSSIGYGGVGYGASFGRGYYYR